MPWDAGRLGWAGPWPSRSGRMMAGAGRRGGPALAVADWADTRDALHLWTQVVAKVRMGPAARKVRVTGL